MKQPLVSVVMSIYKEPIDYLSDAITSIIDQTYLNKELILINDNPGNPNLDFLKKIESEYSFVKLICNKSNLGLPSSLNIGISEASGEYIARMDADDISRNDRLEKQVHFMQSNPNVDLCGSWVKKIDEFGTDLGYYKKPLTHSILVKYSKYATPVLHPTWFFKKSVFKKVGGYKNITPSQDYLFLILALKNNVNLANIPDYLLDYRETDKSLSKKNLAKTIVITNFIREINKIKDYKNLLKKLTNLKDSEFTYLNWLANKRNYHIQNFSVFKYLMIIFFSLLSFSLLRDTYCLVMNRIIIINEKINNK